MLHCDHHTHLYKMKCLYSMILKISIKFYEKYSASRSKIIVSFQITKILRWNKTNIISIINIHNTTIENTKDLLDRNIGSVEMPEQIVQICCKTVVPFQIA